MVAMRFQTLIKLVAALALATLAACAGRQPTIDVGVRNALATHAQDPGLRAYPGLYEIAEVTTLSKREVRDGVLDVQASVQLVLVKDVAQWVKTDGVGGLGEQGFAAYKQFRNAKAGATYDETTTIRFTRQADGWTATPR